MPRSERAVTIADAVRIFSSAKYPNGLSATTAWLGIYQTLLWYEPGGPAGTLSVPHIIDANNLRPTARAQATQATQVAGEASTGRWLGRAQAVDAYLASHLGVQPGQVAPLVDLLMKQPRYIGMQRHNPLGTAFAGLINFIIATLGAPGFSYETEVPAAELFPNVRFAGRGTTSFIDGVVRKDGIPLVIISSKWSLRNDRIKDAQNECIVYKAAYNQIYAPVSGAQLRYYLVTNEFAPARLLHLLNDECPDGVVHVHKPAVVDVSGLNGRLTHLMDLADLIHASTTW
jgi:hypothetical protein